MKKIGINGFGRIGKCIFLQLLDYPNIQITSINIPDFENEMLEFYLKTDSNHHYNKNFTFEIINSNTVKINNQIIHIFNQRDPEKLNWREYNVEYLIDSTGVFLTNELASKHDVDYLIMCAPSKDDTPQFMVNANEHLYKGEKIVSNASCTSNCIIPVLKFLDDNYKIIDGNFNTIHAATASQKTTDTNKYKKRRTCRSILNNIIPHTTGASKSIARILPNLDGKIIGASVRVPVSNVSLVNLNVRLEKKTNIKDILNEMNKTNYIIVEKTKYKVSSDYMTTTCPSIVDSNASMNLNNNQFKFLIWYDNEWSYSYKVIKLLLHMIDYNNK